MVMKLVWRPDAAALARLIPRYAAEGFSYPEVGATQDERLPSGYYHLSRSTVLAGGQSTFDRAADALSSWAMHRRAGLILAASADRAAPEVTVVMALGAGFSGLIIPCRVVWTLDEQDRYGFAYGTLPGHPERGEEAFIVEQADGLVTLTIRAFSKPSNRLVRVISGAGRLAQLWMTKRYERSLADLART
jgi:uncharacterized protein (UPF0548 family)